MAKTMEPYEMAQRRKLATSPLEGEYDVWLCLPCKLEMAEQYNLREADEGNQKRTCNTCGRRRFTYRCFVGRKKRSSAQQSEIEAAPAPVPAPAPAPERRPQRSGVGGTIYGKGSW